MIDFGIRAERNNQPSIPEKSEIPLPESTSKQNRIGYRRRVYWSCQELEAPTTTKEIENVLVFANFHKTFFKGYAKMAKPLYRFTGKKPYVLGQEQQDAFSSLKLALITTLVLALPNSKDLFILDTYASDIAIGAELIQVNEVEERVIAYESFNLTPEQQRY